MLKPQNARARRAGRPLLAVLGVVGATMALIPTGLTVAGAADSQPVGISGAGRNSVFANDTTRIGALRNVTTMTGARDWWAAGYTGQGVDVAVIDSGVVPVEGLATQGKVVDGPDMSFDSREPGFAHLDSFGHGTHMASIIAGRDGGAVAGSYTADQEHFLGMAPDSRVVSVKVADTEGMVDVSQIVAAIDWVVSHRHDDGMNIRVLNLSFGTDTRASYLFDPLAYAAEQAWKAGIVVVASAGNAGLRTGLLAPGLTDPAIGPYVLAVGAADHMNTMALTDDRVAGFSSSSEGGLFARNPDLVAPGRSIEGVKSPGSLLDVTYPEATVDERFMRGSGSSQAAAVTSGAAALILSRYPDATPDQVKALLKRTTSWLPWVRPAWQGNGQLNLRRALAAPLPDAARAEQRWWAATGLGRIERSRGSMHVRFEGVSLWGERDIFFERFESSAWASALPRDETWQGGFWNERLWVDAEAGSVLGESEPGASSPWGDIWSGHRWSGHRWSGHRWSGHRWSGHRWSTGVWSGSSWE